MRAAQEEAATWRPGAPLPLSVRAWLALVERKKGQARP